MVAHLLPTAPSGIEIIRLNATIADLDSTADDGYRYELLT